MKQGVGKFCFFFLIVFSISVASFATVPGSERQALITLYNATGGDSWTDNSGWKTPPLDTDGFAMPGTESGWYGVGVSTDGSTVISLQLSHNNLTGHILSLALCQRKIEMSYSFPK